MICMVLVYIRTFGCFFVLYVGKYTIFPMHPMGNYGSIKLSKSLRQTPVVSRVKTWDIRGPISVGEQKPWTN